MAQTSLLIGALKQALKAHGKTYADIADHLKLSEASVKRLFSQKSFSLQRLDQVCQMIGIEISDLVQAINSRPSAQISELSLEQEQEIVGDLEFLLVTVCVLNRWTLNQIADQYGFTEVECIKYFTKLDRLKMIELLPKNRVKLLVAPNFKWRDNGPIQRFFMEKVESDFFSSRFDKQHERLMVINGMLASSSNAVFQRKLEHLAKEFDELNNDDAGLPFDQRKGTTVVLAMRQWRYGLFGRFRKNDN